MYSAEQRAKAIETFARFGCSAADAEAELGYPSRVTLRNWWKEYQVSGDEFLEREHRRPRYSDEEKQGAVDHHLEHGKSLARTIRAMGVPEPRGARQLGRRARAGPAQIPRAQPQEGRFADRGEGAGRGGARGPERQRRRGRRQVRRVPRRALCLAAGDLGA